MIRLNGDPVMGSGLLTVRRQGVAPASVWSDRSIEEKFVQLPHGAVIALVDGKNFELYRNTGNESGPVLSLMASPNLHEHNKGAGGGRDSSSANPTGHQIDEDAHAAAATEWLNQQVLGHQIEKVMIVASPRTLGVMRQHYHKQLEAALVADLSKDLVGKSGPELLAALQGN